jgi:hypothetical protein
MLPALPILAGLLAGDIQVSEAQARERAEREREELTVYSECREARLPSTVWRVGVEDARLRAGADIGSRTTGILHRGQPVTLLKVDRTSSLVRVDGDRKGFLRNGDLVKTIQPPRDPRPVEECPQPDLNGPDARAQGPLHLPGPDPAEPESPRGNPPRPDSGMGAP